MAFSQVFLAYFEVFFVENTTPNLNKYTQFDSWRKRIPL
jgi:hypothetical protein